MAQKIAIEPTKSYVSPENAAKAVMKIDHIRNNSSLRYFIMQYNGTDPKHIGRFFPVFVGESAINEGVHFHFNIIS